MRYQNRQRGFSLLELLIAMVILGILAALGMVNLNAFKQRAYDTRAEAMMRHIAEAEEAYFTSHEVYVACTHLNCKDILVGIPEIEADITLTVEIDDAGVYNIVASHAKGTGRVYYWR